MPPDPTAARRTLTVLTRPGQISLSTAPSIQRGLLKDLAEQPPAIICDLAGVDTLDPVCTTIFATVANHPTSRWPTTTLLLCGASPPSPRSSVASCPTRRGAERPGPAVG